MTQQADGTDAKQGDPQAQPGQTSGAAPGTSGSTEKTYTEVELQKAISDAKADMGRQVKTLSTQLEETKAGYHDLAKRLEEKELEGIRSDPAAVRAYQSRKALETRTKDLDAREKTLAEREEVLKAREAEIAKTTFNGELQRISKEYGMEVEALTDLGLQDVATIEKVAQRLSGKTAPASTDQEKKPLLRVDSGRSRGGTSLEGMSPSEKIEYGLSKSRKGG